MSCDARPNSLRVWQRAPAARVRLIAWPWCGAGASVYRKLARQMSDRIELAAVQLPGREDRYHEAAARSMTAAVEQVLPSLVAPDHRATVFFGHSMGAVLAWETAREWAERSGGGPALLIVSGHAVPTGPRADATRWHQADDSALMKNIAGLGGTPDVVLRDASLMRALLPALRADYAVLETHAPAQRPHLRCPIVACAGVDDPVVDIAGLKRWSTLTSGASSLHRWPGGHFYLIDQVGELARTMAHWIDLHVRLTKP